MKATAALVLLVLAATATAVDPRGDHPDAPPSTPAGELARFHVPPGFEVQLVASEPEIQKPLGLNFDAAGRLWVSGSALYPWPAATDANGQPIRDFQKGWNGMSEAFRVGEDAPSPPARGLDSVRILSDFGPDGAARKITVFADGLNIPTGLHSLPRPAGARGDSAIVFSIPAIWRLTDTDGDGRADLREPLYDGFGFTDTHGMSSNYLHWIDGWIYGCHGFRNRSEVKDRSGRVTIFESGNTYRFRPDGSRIEHYTHGQTNPYGLTVDPLGRFFSADSHSKPVMLLQPGGHYEGIGKEHDGLGFAPVITKDDHGSSSIAGIACYTDDRFPEEFRGQLFNGNPVTRRINRARLEWDGGTPRAVRQEDFLSCDDPWFRPVQVKVGPDGALWIADFYNPIIGHYELPLTDPRRDRSRGRIWRVVYRGAGVGKPRPAPDQSPASTSELITELSSPSLLLRTQATHELVDRIGRDAAPALQRALDDPTLTATARAHALIALQRVTGARPGTAEYHRLHAAQWEGDETSRVLAFRFAAAEGRASDQLRDAIQHTFTTSPSPTVRLAAWEAFAAVARDISSGDVAAWAATVDRGDAMLVHQARIALREFFHRPYAFDELGDLPVAAVPTIHEALLAVPTPDAAAYLFSQLRTRGLGDPPAQGQLQHVAANLPPDQFGELLTFVRGQKQLEPPQRLRAVDALYRAARRRSLDLPAPARAWLEEALLKPLRHPDAPLLDLAILALRDAPVEAKRHPLEAIVSDGKQPVGRRTAALDALANLGGTTEIARRALADPTVPALRRKAADLLGQQSAWAPLLEALPSAPTELAHVIAFSLAKTDDSFRQLLDTIASGRAPASLLRFRFVSATMAARDGRLRDRAAALVESLPPEDLRLDGVIAQRFRDFTGASPSAARGAPLFQQHCSACHRLRSIGGNVGPNLDGVAARGAQRLIEDILDPNRNVDPAFHQTIVETHDGRTITGGQLREQGDHLTLTDATGAAVSIRSDTVKARTTSKLSLMPSIFETQLSETDFFDLLAHLLSPPPQD